MSRPRWVEREARKPEGQWRPVQVTFLNGDVAHIECMMPRGLPDDWCNRGHKRYTTAARHSASLNRRRKA